MSLAYKNVQSIYNLCGCCTRFSSNLILWSDLNWLKWRYLHPPPLPDPLLSYWMNWPIHEVHKSNLNWTTNFTPVNISKYYISIKCSLIDREKNSFRPFFVWNHSRSPLTLKKSTHRSFSYMYIVHQINNVNYTTNIRINQKTPIFFVKTHEQ